MIIYVKLNPSFIKELYQSISRHGSQISFTQYIDWTAMISFLQSRKKKQNTNGRASKWPLDVTVCNQLGRPNKIIAPAKLVNLSPIPCEDKKEDEKFETYKELNFYIKI